MDLLKTLLILAMLALSSHIVRGFRLHTPRFTRSMTWSAQQGPDLEDIINSPSNTKVKLLKALKLKKKRDDTGLVLVEGFRLIQDALESGLQPDLLLVTEDGASSPLGRHLRHYLLKKEQLECLSFVSDSIYRSLIETEHGQGIIAAFAKPSQSLEPLPSSATTGPLVVLFDKLSDPGNVGTLIRTCYGLGVSAVCSVDSCDVWSPKVLRAAAGVNLHFPVIECKWAKAPSVLATLFNDKPFQVIIADCEASSAKYVDMDYRQPTVLVVGSESAGVSTQAKQLPGKVLQARIPMLRTMDSFNAAVAGSIMLSYAALQRQGEIIL